MQQAKQLAAQITPLPVRYSPLRRCADLAAALGAHWAQPVDCDPLLTEMHFGEWEGRAWRELPRAQLDHWAADVGGFRPPGGESFAALIERVAEALDRWQEPAIWVTHAGVIKALDHLLLGASLAEAASKQVPHLQPLRYSLPVAPIRSR